MVVGAADVGGTWTRAALTNGLRTWRARQRATASPELATLLQTLAQRAGARLPLAALVVAARGVWTRRERRIARARLVRLARHVTVISDAEAAWHAALGGGSGVLILAGTGSIALGRDAQGRWARAGGLGPLLGDDGSAFWLAREWLRRRGDDAHARRLARRADAVARIAALAPYVLARARRGDRVAAAVTRAGQAALAGHVAEVVGTLRLRGVVAVGWSGALMNDARYRAGVARALASSGVRARWRGRAVEPVDAALRLARDVITRGSRANGRPARRVAP